MSEKPPKSDTNPKPPLEQPEVKVTVQPATENDRDLARKVRENVQQGVEKAVKEREGDDAAKQFKRADDAAKQAGVVDGGKIKEIKVDVSGHVNGRKRDQTTVVNPPAPPAPPPVQGPSKPGQSAAPRAPLPPPERTPDPPSTPSQRRRVRRR